jgi:hypothetical protein
MNRYAKLNHKKLTLMRLSTKNLIAKIESLSAQMTPEQLRDFLDVLDSMAIMVEDAKAMPTGAENGHQHGFKLALH